MEELKKVSESVLVIITPVIRTFKPSESPFQETINGKGGCNATTMNYFNSPTPIGREITQNRK